MNHRNTKVLKVLNFSTHNEECGIARYQEMFVDALDQTDSKIKSEFFDVSPNVYRIMSKSAKKSVVRRVQEQLEDFDILHIQHEFSFYAHKDFLALAKAAKKAHKKLIITVHSSPEIAYNEPALASMRPISYLRYIKTYMDKLKFKRTFAAAVRLADTVIIHNGNTSNALQRLGVSASSLARMIIPVPQIKQATPDPLLVKKINKKPGDVIIGAVGFLHKFKGLDHAVKALKFLPENYKLLVVGGLHIDHSSKLYDDISDLIVKLELKDRVYITGYIEDEADLNAAIAVVDICIYPYDVNYYSAISSASLNNAFANHRPVVAYPTRSFIELNNKFDCMVITRGSAYYELAREIGRLDLATAAEKSKRFAQRNNYIDIVPELAAVYQSTFEK